MSFLDNIFHGDGVANALATTGDPVDVSESNPPNAGDVLTATNAGHAVWQPPVPGEGGGDGTATALGTTGAPVDVAASAPPNPGDVLTAIDATHSGWAPLPAVPPPVGGPELTYIDLTANDLTPGYWGILPDGSEGSFEVIAPDPITGSRFGVQRLDNTSHDKITILGGGDLQGADGNFYADVPIAQGAYCEWTYVEDLGAWYLTVATPGFGDAIDPPAVGATLSGDPGSNLSPARSNHTHAVLTGSPVALTVGGAMAPGSSQLLPHADHVHAMPGLATTAASGFQSAADKTKIDSVEAGAQITSFARVQTALGGGTSAVSLNGQRLISVADPSGPQDVATRAYVDSVAQGLDVHVACRAVAISNITLSGTQTIDGVALVAGDRVLVTGQTTAANNGIYTVAAGAWVRATDADVSAEVKSGLYTLITAGTVYASSAWVLTTEDPITLGTTPLVFAQYSSAAQAIAGGGLTRTGNTFDVGAHADASIVVNADTIQVGVLATDVQHGNRGGGTLHAVATTTVAGFLSAADKTRLDGLVATTAPSQITIATAAPGSNANVAARIDHIHSVSTGTPVALTLGGANAPGNATSLAPSNHVHALPASNVAPAALTVGATGAPGSSAAISNAGHVHAMPGVATVLTDGFMIWSDKLTLDGLIGNPNPGINGFRLAPTSDDSIPADGIYNNLYLVAVDGDCIGLYDVVAGGWRQCRVTPFSQAVSGRTGGRPFDVFLALSFPAPIDGTASSVVMEFVDWSSTNTRATGLTRVKGVWTKAGDQTRRYLGTVLPSSAVAYQWILQGGGTTSANMPIWNAANRRLVTLRYQPAYDTYKIPESAVVYRWGNVTQAQIGIVRGDSLEPVNLQASCSVFPNSAEVSVGIGIDNLAMVGGRTFAKTTNDANAVVTIQAQYAAYLSGYRAYIPLMVTGYQESTFYGNHASPGGTVSISTLYATTTQ